MLALLAATTTAFALTEALKLDRTPVARPKFNVVFSPVCDCARETARLPVKFKKADTIDAVVVDEGGDAVRTLALGQRQPRGRFVFRWDGKDAGGQVVPDGTYHLRLSFANDGRTIELPNKIRVDTNAPSVEIISVAEDPLTVVARTNERARLLLLVEAFVKPSLLTRSRFENAGVMRLVWTGSTGGPRASLAIVAQDLAGNRSTPAGLSLPREPSS
jgi:FlgD Ig-like domain